MDARKLLGLMLVVGAIFVGRSASASIQFCNNSGQEIWTAVGLFRGRKRPYMRRHHHTASGMVQFRRTGNLRCRMVPVEQRYLRPGKHCQLDDLCERVLVLRT